jgi:hypothetical protein
MCLDASHCPRQPATQPLAAAFLGLLSERLAVEGGLIAERVLRERWRHQGLAPRELDELLAGNRLRSVACGSQRWLPAFQLHADGVTPRADVAAVADELAGGMDANEILAWFACRNAALDGQTPIARLRTGLPAVLDAARLDRFICSA